MNLQQLQVNYRPEEDRILFRISFTDDDKPLQEISTWITRRFLKKLWPGMIKSIKTQVGLDHPLAAHASAEIVSMEHLASVSAIRARGDFNAPFETGVDAYPHGDSPVIISSVNIQLTANQPSRIKFEAGDKMNFEVCFQKAELHGLCMLLQDCIKTADWGIEPLMESATELESGPRVLN